MLYALLDFFVTRWILNCLSITKTFFYFYYLYKMFSQMREFSDVLPNTRIRSQKRIILKSNFREYIWSSLARFSVARHNTYKSHICHWLRLSKFPTGIYYFYFSVIKNSPKKMLGISHAVSSTNKNCVAYANNRILLNFNLFQSLNIFLSYSKLFFNLYIAASY